MKYLIYLFSKCFFSIELLALLFMVKSGAQELNALIIDGQNNHSVWPKGTVMMKQYLEETGLFKVDIKRTAFTWQGEELLSEFPLKGDKTAIMSEPTADPDYSPKFSNYDVVVSNFGWRAAPWPVETQKSLEAYVLGGGGLVIIHAASNSWGDWDEFNKMIGLGGWGGRTEKHGPYVYYNDKGELIRDTSPGRGGSHGPEHEFQIIIRDGKHPITKGMPDKWLHSQDELYDRLRGPAENMHILATAFSDLEKKGTGRHEPMLFTVNYGQGRVFHSALGHQDYSLECVGFIETFKRGTEWAATGKVSKSMIPDDFPTADNVSRREFKLDR